MNEFKWPALVEYKENGQLVREWVEHDDLPQVAFRIIRSCPLSFELRTILNYSKYGLTGVPLASHWK